MLSAFNPQGTPLSSTGFGAADTGNAYGLAIDPNDNVWLTLDDYGSHNGTRGAIEEFSGVSSRTTLGTPTIFMDNSLDYPYAIAADSNGSLFIANNSVLNGATNLATFNPSTGVFASVPTGSGFGFSVGLAPDTAHGVWITGTSGNISLEHIDASGNLVSHTDCCSNTDAVALDSTGHVWMADEQNTSSEGGENGAVTELASDGTILQDFITSGGISHPSHIAIDASQNVWISNLHTPTNDSSSGSEPKNQSFSELAGSNSSSPGTAISRSTGYGLDAGLLLPYALAVDPSGNIWISNTGGASLVMFFGMGAPTKTPLPVTPQAP
jgi:streptogramin lyase